MQTENTECFFTKGSFRCVWDWASRISWITCSFWGRECHLPQTPSGDGASIRCLAYLYILPQSACRECKHLLPLECREYYRWPHMWISYLCVLSALYMTVGIENIIRSRRAGGPWEYIFLLLIVRLCKGGLFTAHEFQKCSTLLFGGIFLFLFILAPQQSCFGSRNFMNTFLPFNTLAPAKQMAKLHELSLSGASNFLCVQVCR